MLMLFASPGVLNIPPHFCLVQPFISGRCFVPFSGAFSSEGYARRPRAFLSPLPVLITAPVRRVCRVLTLR